MKLIEIVPAHSIAHRMEIRRMGADVIPRDKSWQVIAVLLAIWIPFVVMFVRWWVCV